MADEKLLIGLRYCGGCNPRFDRVAMVKELQKQFPDCTFVAADKNHTYSATLVICGCSARCVQTDDLTDPLIVSSREEFPRLQIALETAYFHRNPS